MLNSFSKCLEKVMVRQLQRHLEENNLLSDNQHGFRPNRSTQTCILQLQNKILKEANKGNDTLLILADCSAAFDTVTHSVLLDKLRLYGADPTTLRWFDDYLRDRFQFTEIGGQRSQLIAILQGVFQGSLGGPLLYCLYVNCITVMETIRIFPSLYADDNSIAKTLTGNRQLDQEETDRISEMMSDFMKANRLKFNAKKTHFMIITTKQRRTFHGIRLFMDGQEVKQTRYERLLGVQISDDANFHYHVEDFGESVIKQLKQRLRVLRKVTDGGDYNQRKILTQGLFMSKLTYCLSVWSGVPQTLRDKLTVLQNDALRLIHKKKRTDRLIPMYKQSNILQFHKLCTYFDQVQLYNIIKTKTPFSLYQDLQPEINHNHYTRQTTRNFIRPTRDNSGGNSHFSSSFVPRAIDFYNNHLPDWIKGIDRKDNFKFQLKKFLMNTTL